MKSMRYLAAATLLFLLACQPQTPTTIAILDSGQIHTLQTSERTPAALLAQAGIILAPADRVLSLGQPVPLDQPLGPAKTYTLQIRRAVSVTLVTPSGQQVIQVAASTVGEALSKAGISAYAADKIDPPAETPISSPLTITYTPSRELTVTTGGRTVRIRSAARSVGQALAEAGVPLQGLDTSSPSEDEALPSDGLIRVVRVSESVILAQKSIPFKSEFIASADVELDHQEVLQPGEAGLAMSRVRIRYEDGQEVDRRTESETVVRPPKDRVVGYGTKVVVHTDTVGGAQIQYWRAVRMFATSYSPCRSAADRCYSGTASGKPVKKGVVAVVYRWYVYMQGQPIYIPGYGYATIEDVGGGIPGRPWIDLGYSDSDWQEWGEWVTVYFLTPVPPHILYVLE